MNSTPFVLPARLPPAQCLQVREQQWCSLHREILEGSDGLWQMTAAQVQQPKIKGAEAPTRHDFH